MIRSDSQMIRSDGGYSLIELLISLLVLTLLLGGLYSVLFQSQVTFEAQQDSMAMRQEARVAISQLATELRMAGYNMGNLTEPITDADTNRLAFVADIDDGSPNPPCDGTIEGAADGGAERISLRLDGATGDLLRTVDCWDGASWINEYTDQVVARNVLGTDALFRYFDENGGEIVPGAGGLTAAERETVRAVSLAFSLEDTSTTQIVGDPHTNFQITTSVKLRNVEE